MAIIVTPPIMGSYDSINLTVESEDNAVIIIDREIQLHDTICGLSGGNSYFLSVFSILGDLKSNKTRRYAISTGKS